MKKEEIKNIICGAIAGIIIAGSTILGMTAATQYNQEKFIETLRYEIQLYNEREWDHMSNSERVQHMNEMGMMLYQLGN